MLSSFGRAFVLIGIVVAACATARADAAPASAGATLARIAAAYYGQTWKINPVDATDTGVHRYDAQLGSYGAGDFATEIKRLHGTLSAVNAIPTKELSLDDQIDQAILRNSIMRDLWALEIHRSWMIQPRIYTEIASNGIYSIMKRSYAPLDVRLGYVIARENQIPRLIAQAEGNLAPARVSPVSAKLAELDTAGAIDFFSHDVPAAFAGEGDSGLQARFRASTAVAVSSLRRYQQFITGAIEPQARGKFAIGVADYQYLEDLQNAVHIPVPQILAVGEAALAHDRAAFVATAAKIDPTKTPEQVFATIGAKHPSADQLLATAQAELRDLVDFIKAKGIIDLPDAPIAKVIATPKFEAQTSFASMDSPGPLETKATEAYYRVTPVDPSWTRKQADEHLRFFNTSSLAVVSLHEAYPGHYTNYLFNKRSNLSLIRKLNWNVAFGEGWAHYDEQMMVDEGLGNGDPHMRMAQLALALQRECRFIVGIKEHTQGMTVGQATQFFMRNAFMGQEPSYREALRGTQDPLYGYYTLGKLMLLKLRADDRAKLGAAFCLRVFHDQVLSHGDPPIYYLRKLILGANDNGTLL